MNSNFVRGILFFYIIAFTIPPSVYSLEVETHEAINETIAKGIMNGFSLDSYLKTNLGINKGVEESFNDKDNKANVVYDWIKLGGRYEDKPPEWYSINYLRSFNHYHDPITNKGYLGMWNSASQWALMARNTQSPYGYYSWNDVRYYFYTALTSTDATTRSNYFTETFRGLGQLMHLVSDMSVPAHTRNDGHVAYNYENWVADPDNKVNFSAMTPMFFGNSITSISNLFDTDQYDGSNPSNSNGIGLSEYTNANFFSEETIFSASFPHPAKDETDARIIEVTAEDGGIDKRYYIYKTDGGYNLAAYTYFTNDLDQSYTGIKGEWKYILDEEIYKGYAGILLPRAVGYSASLLNHFFRGQIEITLPDKGVYAITPPGDSISFKEIRIKARNITSTGEDMSNGQIQLVVKYKVALEDPFQSTPVPTSDFSYIVVPEKNNVNSIPKDTPVELTFDLSANPIPLWATDIYIQVVYRGQVGSEAGAVAVGFKDISEPTPIDLINNMDYSCINGTYMLSGSPEAITAVDFDLNGTADWDVFPHGLINDYLTFSPVQNPRYASSTKYNAFFAEIPPAQYGRVYLLTDYDLKMSNKVSVKNLNSRDTWVSYLRTKLYSITGIKNQTEYETTLIDIGGVLTPVTYKVRHYPILWTERGLKMGWSIWYENAPYPVGTSCATSDAQPNLIGPVNVIIP